MTSRQSRSKYLRSKCSPRHRVILFNASDWVARRVSDLASLLLLLLLLLLLPGAVSSLCQLRTLKVSAARWRAASRSQHSSARAACFWRAHLPRSQMLQPPPPLLLLLLRLLQRGLTSVLCPSGWT